jgi:hypothetical protein
MTDPAFRRQGFAQQDIVTRWSEIVGPALGATSLPEKLGFPPGKRRGGTLIVRVDGGMALELQHLSPQVIERVNGYFGYRAVEKIVIRQGPLPPRVMRRKTQAKKLSPEDEASLEKQLSDTKDSRLRNALKSLGGAVLGRQSD